MKQPSPREGEASHNCTNQGCMLAVRGTYREGKVVLDESVEASDPVPVIVTFLNESTSGLIRPEVDGKGPASALTGLSLNGRFDQQNLRELAYD